MRLVCLLALLAACTRDFAVPAAGDRTPPVLSRFAVTPQFAKAGATVTLTFEANELLLSATARLAGSDATCTVHGASASCTAVVSASMAEGDAAIDVTARDLVQNEAVAPAAATITIDFTPPALVVSESPSPAIKGSPTSFVVDANEPLGAVPTIAAEFLAGAPVCAGAVPGTRFVCTGASISDAASVGPASFTASGEDRAGNKAVSAAGAVQVQNPVLPPPHVTVQAVSPNPATIGTEVSITLAANQPLTNCAASVAGQLAPCADPSGSTCVCHFTVPSSLVEGNAIVLGFATSDNGTGTGSGGVQLDFTPPVIDAVKAGAVRHPVGTNDGASGDEGAVTDVGGVAYAGRKVRVVRLWASETAPAPLAEVVPNADGSFSETALPGTDGTSDTRLAPTDVWISAVDLAGNESQRVSGTQGFDEGPVADGTQASFARNPIGTPDHVAGPAGTLSANPCAIRKVEFFADDFDSDTPLFTAPANGDGSFDVAIGTATSSYAHLWLSAADKCGMQTLSPRPPVTGNDDVTPTADGTQMTIHRRDTSALDSVEGSLSAVSSPVCALAGVNVYDNGSAELLASGPAAGDGSFAEVPFGTTTLSAAVIAVTAVDKCGLESDKAIPIDGADPGPVLDGTQMTLTMRGAMQDSTVGGAPGGVFGPVSVITSLQLLDENQQPIGATFLPDVDGSFVAQSIGPRVLRRAYLSARDKAGATATAVVQNVTATLDLAGHVPLSSVPNPAAMYAIDTSLDPTASSPGMGPLLGPEVADLAKVSAEDSDAISTTGTSFDASAAFAAAQLPFPTGRSGPAFAYDPDEHRVILFGGNNGGDLGDTWALDGNGWTRLSPSNSPPPRFNAAMAWDAAGSRLILFGGKSGASTWLSDTWAWAGGTWTPIFPSHIPNAREQHGMASTAAGVMLFGGLNNGATNDETWLFAGSDWSRPTPIIRPGPRRGHGMVSTGSTVLLFGGADTGSIGTDDTWRFDPSNNTWTQLHPATTPLARASLGLAFDTGRQKTVMLGGFPGDDPVTWEFNGADWTPLSPAAIPDSRYRFGIAYDPDRSQTLVFGGFDYFYAGNGFHGDLWSWDGAQWTDEIAAPSTRQGQAMAYDIARDRIVMYGGTHDRATGLNVDETWEFDGTKWQKKNPAHKLGLFADASMAYDAARGKVVMFGGIDGGGSIFHATAEWDGNDWTFLPLSPTPSSRSGAGMVYDATRARMVLFGGGGADDGQGLPTPLGDQWSYDGRKWTQVSANGAPSARFWPLTAWDGVRSKAILVGGAHDVSGSPAYFTDAFAFNGFFDWSGDGVALPGMDPRRGAMGFNPVTGAIVIPEGAYANADMGSFFQASPATSWYSAMHAAPPARGEGGLVWDSARSRFVLFGGGNGAVRYSDLWAYSGAGGSFLATQSQSFSANRWPAHIFSFPADGAATLSRLHVRWVGSATSGAKLMIWDETQWTQIANDTDLDLTQTDYRDSGRIWICATADKLATLTTDFIALEYDATLPAQ